MKRCPTCLGRFKPKGTNHQYCSMGCTRLYRDRARSCAKYARRSPVRYEFFAKDWFILLRKCDYRCVYCRGKFPINMLTMEHIVPLSRGGTHSAGNIAPSCQKCNQEKGDKTYVEWQAILASPIFNTMMAEHRRMTPKKHRIDLKIDKYGHRGV